MFDVRITLYFYSEHIKSKEIFSRKCLFKFFILYSTRFNISLCHFLLICCCVFLDNGSSIVEIIYLVE